MKMRMYGLLAVAGLGLASTVGLSAPAAPAPPTVGGGKPVVKGVLSSKTKTIVITCPGLVDGTGLPTLSITPVGIPTGWSAGSTTAIRLMTTTIADGKFTCAYGGARGSAAFRTSKVIPTGYSNCTVTADKAIKCVY